MKERIFMDGEVTIIYGCLNKATCKQLMRDIDAQEILMHTFQMESALTDEIMYHLCLRLKLDPLNVSKPYFRKMTLNAGNLITHQDTTRTDYKTVMLYLNTRDSVCLQLYAQRD